MELSIADRLHDELGNPVANLTLLALDNDQVVNVAEGNLAFLRRWAEENYPEVDFPNIIKIRVLEYLEHAEDLTEDNIEIVADPRNDGVWAARVTPDYDFGSSQTLPLDLVVYPDDIEEVEFKTWPPTASY